MTDPILTFQEVAVLLRLAERTVYAMAQEGLIPAFKVRGQWRFKHDDVDRCIGKQKAAIKGIVGKGLPDV